MYQVHGLIVDVCEMRMIVYFRPKYYYEICMGSTALAQRATFVCTA